MRLKDFKKDLLKDLQDPEFAVAYLKDAIEEGDLDGFLLAVRDVVEAKGGIGQLSEQVDLNRVSLYKSLSENGNPLFSTIQEILDNFGIGLQPYIKDKDMFLGHTKTSE